MIIRRTLLFLLCLGIFYPGLLVAQSTYTLGQDIGQYYSFSHEREGFSNYGKYGSALSCRDDLILIGILGIDNNNGEVELLDLSTNNYHIFSYPYGSNSVEFGKAITFTDNMAGYSGPNAVIGAPYADFGNGSVSIFSGLFASPANSHIETFYPSETSGARFGGQVLSIGDIGGYNWTEYVFESIPDGSSEIIVSAPYSDQYGSNAGRVTVYDTVNDHEICTIPGSSNEELGSSVALIHDLNGDSRPELAIGAPGYQGNDGAVKVYSITEDNNFQPVHLGTVSGGELSYSDYRLGYNLIDAGDVNDDFTNDVLVSMQDYNYINPGRVVLLSGNSFQAGSSAEVLCDIVSPDPDDHDFGESLVGLGNLDGIPGDEFAVSSSHCSSQLTENGCVYLYSYRLVQQPNTWDCQLLAKIKGPQSYYRAGISLAACDFDDDGKKDLAIGTKKNVAPDQFQVGSVVFYVSDTIDQCPNDPDKTQDGICGCGIPDLDLNENGTVDCLETGDSCPDDPYKTLPGICGCGVPDEDIDLDGTVDCQSIDYCPDDPDKDFPGICGCGYPDEDLDQDGTTDCLDWGDACPDDPYKLTPGICGCGIPDEDIDQDGTVDCQSFDYCPGDPDKAFPGMCGCGIPDQDLDQNGIVDCLEWQDGCYDDSDKTAPGICGCGIPDEDLDNNGTIDCLQWDDGCPDDPHKSFPGICGCGIPDEDLDQDGEIDCFHKEFCPDHDEKKFPGICGCGILDEDLDSNGIVDCLEWNDVCPDDPNKLEPGICGCGIPDTDLDNNDQIDCHEQDFCPDDPNKTTPGICGCGIPDGSNDDTTAIDCLEDDLCPGDLEKSKPGICGCGIPDTDEDGDGVLDCVQGVDYCPDDPDKTIPGACGCGIPDTDTDGDSTPDCWDECPEHPDKGTVNVCGCGVPVDDVDENGIADCLEDIDKDDLKQLKPPPPQDSNFELDESKKPNKQDLTITFDQVDLDDELEQKKGNYYIRWRIKLTKTGKANSQAVTKTITVSKSKKKKTTKKKLSKRNDVTFKKLKSGSYKVKYRWELVKKTKKKKNGKRVTKTKVVSKSSYSSSKSFTLNSSKG